MGQRGKESSRLAERSVSGVVASDQCASDKCSQHEVAAHRPPPPRHR